MRRLSETDRLEAFSDGVMAVVITIMAFEIRAPVAATLSALQKDVPNLLVYLLSFAFVGIYWNNHHHLLRATERISGAVMWANLHLLFWLSLLPVATAWVARFPLHVLTAATYGVVGLGAAVAYWVLVRTIIGVNGNKSAIARAIGSDFKGNVSVVAYLAGIGLAFVTPVVSYFLYGAVALVWFVPDRRLVVPSEA